MFKIKKIFPNQWDNILEKDKLSKILNDTIPNAVTITLDLLLKNGDFPLTTRGILNIFSLHTH